MVEKCLGMTTLDHVITVRTIILKGKLKSKLKFIFLTLNNRYKILIYILTGKRFAQVPTFMILCILRLTFHVCCG